MCSSDLATKMQEHRDGNGNDGVFAWIDIGSFRQDTKDSDNTIEKEDSFLLKHPEVVPNSEMLFWSHYSTTTTTTFFSSSTKTKEGEGKTQKKVKSYTPHPPVVSPYFDDKKLQGGKYFFHAGSHFAGRRLSIKRFYIHFLHTVDIFIIRNLTLADDQAVLQSACLSYYFNFDNAEEAGEVSNSSETATSASNKNNNLCAYASRGTKVNITGNNGKHKMTARLHKWFGLSTILQNGLLANNTSATKDDYWRPPPQEHYLENQRV